MSSCFRLCLAHPAQVPAFLPAAVGHESESRPGHIHASYRPTPKTVSLSLSLCLSRSLLLFFVFLFFSLCLSLSLSLFVVRGYGIWVATSFAGCLAPSKMLHCASPWPNYWLRCGHIPWPQKVPVPNRRYIGRGI